MLEHQEQLSGSLQENALTLLCTDSSYCNLVRHSIPTELFSTFLFRDVVSRVYAYIDQFKQAPGAHLPDLVEDLLEDKGPKGDSIRALLHSIAELAEGLNAQYVVTKLEHFVRQQKLKLGIVEATQAIQNGDVEGAERVMVDAMKARLSMFDAGLDLDGVVKDIQEYKQDDKHRVLLGIPELDDADYGPGRGELLLLQAPLKTGKTWFLVHVAKRALMQRWKVLYVTLEVSAQIIGRR